MSVFLITLLKDFFIRVLSNVRIGSELAKVLAPPPPYPNPSD